MKCISFYLPQYHPIPENDDWWGKGFTEWRNVAKARPRFSGHRQPQLPADLGYYDLRLRDTKVAQWDMAIANGIDAFCYYHYWFDGRRLLETPIEQLLKDPTIPHEFCLCWANENWTRAWDGREREVLISQTYTDDDCEAHALLLGRIMSDVRYLRIEDAPLLIIYRPDKIPNTEGYLETWRQIFSERFGLDTVHIAGCYSGLVSLKPSEIIQRGFDSIIDFQPNREFFPVSTPSSLAVSIAKKVLPDAVYEALKVKSSAVQRVDYSELVDHFGKRDWPTEFLQFPVVFPSWDNTARRRTPTVIQNSKPSEFKRWLDLAASKISGYDHNKSLVFINAWNEWAEGCHLEPDEEMGKAFLGAVKEAKRVL